MSGVYHARGITWEEGRGDETTEEGTAVFEVVLPEREVG